LSRLVDAEGHENALAVIAARATTSIPPEPVRNVQTTWGYFSDFSLRNPLLKQKVIDGKIEASPAFLDE